MSEFVTRATARIGAEHYQVDVTAGRHMLVGDEPPARGGGDKGPAPYELLLASLGSCTAITLKMYAEKKGWPLTGLEVGLAHIVTRDDQRIERVLTVLGELDDAQRARLAEIAERTPVTLTLKSALRIDTRLG